MRKIRKNEKNKKEDFLFCCLFLITKTTRKKIALTTFYLFFSFTNSALWGGLVIAFFIK